MDRRPVFPTIDVGPRCRTHFAGAGQVSQWKFEASEDIANELL